MGQFVKFLYQIDKAKFLLSEKTPRELRPLYPRAELLRQFHDLDSARKFCAGLKGEVVDEITKRDTFDKEHREKLRQKKLGKLNPNSKGLLPGHRRNIGRSMKGKNQAQFNVNYGKRRTFEVRAKISLTKKEQAAIRKRRWCVSDSGKEHLVFYDFILPAGWAWGRKRLRV